MKFLGFLGMVRVKICGITSIEDALLSVRCGAVALGFNFFSGSPRYIEPEHAAHIIKMMPPFIHMVGVFVNENPDVVKAVVSQCRLDCIQLHGDESIEYCEQMRWKKLIKAIRVKTEEDIEKLPSFPVDYFLLDTYHVCSYGGTGKQFNWKFLNKIDTSMKTKIIIAGGITPKNVSDLLKTYTPEVIDVCSGVESAHGKKDCNLMNSLFKIVSSYNVRNTV